MNKQFFSLSLVLILTSCGTAMFGAADELPYTCTSANVRSVGPFCSDGLFCSEGQCCNISGNQGRLRRVHEDQAYREACLNASTDKVTCLSRQLEGTFGSYTDRCRDEFGNEEVTCFDGAPCAFNTTRRGLSWIASLLCCSAVTLASGCSCSPGCACCCLTVTAAPRVLHIWKVSTIVPSCAIPAFEQELAERRSILPPRTMDLSDDDSFSFLPEKTMDFGAGSGQLPNIDPMSFLSDKSPDLK